MRRNGTYLLIFLFICLGIGTARSSEFQQRALVQRYLQTEEIDWSKLTNANKSLVNTGLYEMVANEYNRILKLSTEKSQTDGVRRILPDELFVFANLGDYLGQQLNRKSNLRSSLAQEYIKDGAPHIAADIYNNVLMSDPKNVEAAVMRSDLFFSMRMYLEALQSYEYLLTIDRENERALHKLGILKVSLGQYDEAAGYFRRLLKKNPNHQDARRYLDMYDGKVSSKSGSSSRKVNEVAVQHFISGEKLFSAGRFEEAANEYSLAIENDPHYYKAYAYLGECLARLKKYDDSETILEQAIMLDPKEPEAYHFLGLTLEKQYSFTSRRDLLKRALDNYKKAQEVSPSYASVREDLERAQNLMEGKVD